MLVQLIASGGHAMNKFRRVPDEIGAQKLLT
jgi:hypothetical protein